MQNEAAGLSNGHSPENAASWPPQPTSDVEISESPGIAADIRAFPTQNGFLLFFLLLITLGIYAPFWIARTARIINKLTFPTALPLSYVWSLLAFLVTSIGLDFTTDILVASGSSVAATFKLISGIVRFSCWIYHLVIVFRVRGALNTIIDESTATLGNFSSFGTFFLGSLYLQVRLNQLIRQLSRNLAPAH